jgi:hypothetical protein
VTTERAATDRVYTIRDLLAATPDPDAVDEHWRRICQEMVKTTAAAEYERGLADGYAAAVACAAAGVAWKAIGTAARTARTGAGKASGSRTRATSPAPGRPGARRERLLRQDLR